MFIAASNESKPCLYDIDRENRPLYFDECREGFTVTQGGKQIQAAGIPTTCQSLKSPILQTFYKHFMKMLALIRDEC